MGLCQHLRCQEEHKLLSLFIRFLGESGLTWGQGLRHNRRTCFIAAPGTHRNRPERQEDTDGEGDAGVRGRKEGSRMILKTAWHRLQNKAYWAGTHHQSGHSTEN